MWCMGRGILDNVGHLPDGLLGEGRHQDAETVLLRRQWTWHSAMANHVAGVSLQKGESLRPPAAL